MLCFFIVVILIFWFYRWTNLVHNASLWRYGLFQHLFISEESMLGKKQPTVMSIFQQTNI
ncbi:MAG TPA: hypothetical protein DCL86_03715 [Bacteroidales bacterium]|nr:hypothetical protein [Bacteroidales bacterium]